MSEKNSVENVQKNVIELVKNLSYAGFRVKKKCDKYLRNFEKLDKKKRTDLAELCSNVSQILLQVNINVETFSQQLEKWITSIDSNDGLVEAFTETLEKVKKINECKCKSVETCEDKNEDNVPQENGILEAEHNEENRNIDNEDVIENEQNISGGEDEIKLEISVHELVADKNKNNSTKINLQLEKNSSNAINLTNNPRDNVEHNLVSSITPSPSVRHDSATTGVATCTSVNQATECDVEDVQTHRNAQEELLEESNTQNTTEDNFDTIENDFNKTRSQNSTPCDTHVVETQIDKNQSQNSILETEKIFPENEPPIQSDTESIASQNCETTLIVQQEEEVPVENETILQFPEENSHTDNEKGNTSESRQRRPEIWEIETEKATSSEDDRENDFPDNDTVLYDVTKEVLVLDVPMRQERRRSAASEAQKIYEMYLAEQQEEEEEEVTSESCPTNDSDSDSFDVNIDNSDLLDSDENDSNERNSNGEITNNYDIREFSVLLEKNDEMEAMLCDFVWGTSPVKKQKRIHNSDAEIERLCDLSNVLKKNRTPSKKRKYKKLTKRKTKTSDSSSSLSELSESDFEYSWRTSTTCSEDEFPRKSPDGDGSKVDATELMAMALLDNIRDDSSSELTGDEESETEMKENAKKRRKDKKIKKEPAEREDIQKKRWRKDPLLKGRLTSDSDSEKSDQERKRIKLSHENCSNNDDSDATIQENVENHLSDLIFNGKCMSTDIDSEIEFVAVTKETKKKRRAKHVIAISDDTDVEERHDTSAGKTKGRRNIRALMTDQELAEATQKANQEEEERIARLQERQKIKETYTLSQDDADECLVLDVDKDTMSPLIKIHSTISKRLKPHQIKGIQFMWDSCYESVEKIKDGWAGSGCILAHCMGLGKTLQALALIQALFSHDITRTKHVLVVCPLSTVLNWKKEYQIAFRNIKDCDVPFFAIGDKKDNSRKLEIVQRWKRRGGMLVMGYEAFSSITSESRLEKMREGVRKDVKTALLDPGPDLVVCDEGHLLRNKQAQRTLALNKVKTKRRIVLTGTPLQNNLLEYYHMVHFVKPNLLGTEKEFKTNFVNPITNGQYEDSTSHDIKLMKYRTHVLHRMLKKTVQRVEDSELKTYLPKLVDYGVFIRLHELQAKLYDEYLSSAERHCTNPNGTFNKKCFLSDVLMVKSISSHPHLLSLTETINLKKIKEHDVIDETDKEKVEDGVMPKGWWKRTLPEDVATNVQYGNKFMAVMTILEECEAVGDKTLIFSQSLCEMDCLEHFLSIRGTPGTPSWRKNTHYYRMDGTVLPELRTMMCDKFNDPKNKNLKLLIMSTKVGGLGLNLTAANRVILMSVSWNPSYDTQSIFRAFRFGQEKPVFVYRLIAMDTMEEKMYQRQVTKLAIAHRVVDKHQITRHYSSLDIHELYSIRPRLDAERPIPNVPEDKVLAKLLQKFTFVFKWHEHQGLLANRPEEDLDEQEKNAAWEEFNKRTNEPVIFNTPLMQGPQFTQYVNASNLLNGPSTMLPKPPQNITDVANETQGDHTYSKGPPNPDTPFARTSSADDFRVAPVTKRHNVINPLNLIMPASVASIQNKLNALIRPNPVAMKSCTPATSSSAQTKCVNAVPARPTVAIRNMVAKATNHSLVTKSSGVSSERDPLFIPPTMMGASATTSYSEAVRLTESLKNRGVSASKVSVQHTGANVTKRKEPQSTPQASTSTSQSNSSTPSQFRLSLKKVIQAPAIPPPVRKYANPNRRKEPTQIQQTEEISLVEDDEEVGLGATSSSEVIKTLSKQGIVVKRGGSTNDVITLD